MALSPAPLVPGTADTVALSDFNAAIALLNAAFPLIAANINTDAVETAKIKNLAVTVGKLAGGITALKLAADCVETVKIKGLNVTDPKLADAVIVDRLIENFLRRERIFYDTFHGSILSELWTKSGDAGGDAYVYAHLPYLIIKTSATINEKYRVSWNAKGRIRNINEKPTLLVRMGSTIDNTNVKILVLLYSTPNDYIGFRFDTSVGANWVAVCRTVGAETTVDTGVAPAAYQRLKVKCIDASSVKFYINEVEEADIGTNIGDITVEPWIELETLENVAKEAWFDFVLLLSDV